MRILISEDDVVQTVQRMASEVRATYGGRPLTMIGVLTGSLVLLADLIRQVSMPVRVGVVQASSYRGATTRGSLTINADLLLDIRGHDVLVVDDIFDTGHTLAALIGQLEKLGPHSIRTAVLLRKSGRQEVAMQPDWIGVEIPDVFVVGYGLDYRDAYRHLPFVGVLEEADLSREPAEVLAELPDATRCGRPLARDLPQESV